MGTLFVETRNEDGSGEGFLGIFSGGEIILDIFTVIIRLIVG